MSDIASAISGAAYTAYESSLLRKVKGEKVPRHLAIIMDGNRRYAKEIGMDTVQGHIKGRDKLEELLDWCLDVGISVLTVYAFSTENLTREPEEVEALMDLFEENFIKIGNDNRVHRHKIKVRAIGQLSLLPERVLKAIEFAEEKTKNYSNYTYNIAVAYGSREELIHAIKGVASDVKSGKLGIEDITEKEISGRLYTKDLPDPDLILRTSGEERISNFLLWQLAYSELYFTDIYWPGLRKIDFLRAIRSYQNRQRRYGK